MDMKKEDDDPMDCGKEDDNPLVCGLLLTTRRPFKIFGSRAKHFDHFYQKRSYMN
jgi:hypothetical protein